jgi:AcrR family transcriptional regulator
MTDGPPTPPLADVRTRVLDAAEAIVLARGVNGLTLEAVARDAGVSKGGLLYHFASKEALLDAMLRRLAGLMEAQYEAGVAAQPEGPGRVARACLEWGFGEADPSGEAPLHACDERHDRAAAVFLAAFHHDPALLEPIRAVVARIRAEIEGDGLPPGVGHAINAACDGMLLARLFRLYEPGPQERARTRAALARMLEQGG